LKGSHLVAVDDGYLDLSKEARATLARLFNFAFAFLSRRKLDEAARKGGKAGQASLSF
jgi:hypothetical protein